MTNLMDLQKAIYLLIEHRNGYASYSPEQVYEAKCCLLESGYFAQWYQDETGHWSLEVRK